MDAADRRRSAIGYLVAIGAVGVLTVLKLSLPVLSAHPFALLLMPVLVSAWAGGALPGLFATGLAWFSARYLLDSHNGAHDPVPLGVVLFSIQAVTASLLFGTFHRERRRLMDALYTGERRPTPRRARVLDDPHRQLIGFAVAIAGSAAVTGVKFLFAWPSPHPYALFLLPVVVSAWFGGLLPGLAATALGLLGADYLFIGNPGLDFSEPIPMAVFASEAIAASVMLELLRRERVGLREAVRVAGEKHSALAASKDLLRQAHDALDQSTRHEIQRQRAGRAAAENALKVTEEQLRQSQKMEAVGRLAAGVAHDFNNLLTVILTYSALVRGGLPKNDPLRGYLEEIDQAGLRAGSLTRQLLAFSRQQVQQPRILDLGEVVARMEQMITRLVGAQVEVRIMRPEGLGRVKADPGHLEQVLMNLVVNARDAMPNGGTLTIELRNLELDAGFAGQHLGVTPGPHVVLTVSDTGIGMDAATLGRLFDPFFTTKEKGTGLGLSVVYGIVRQSGGTVWVYSELGRGSTFKVYLPRSDESALPSAPSAAEPRRTRGTETILLVEDDQKLRAVMREILEGEGYRVVDAADGSEATRQFEAAAKPIDLLLTDLELPHLNGRQLAQELGRIHPELRVLFMSGGVIDTGIAFVEKPIAPEALLAKVRAVLDAPPDSAAFRLTR